ncbi:MAG: SMP-30/gluconolactonase/LRE family protein [Betaproteobacteria bacterium]|nr:SMP-30/gluconolactonase/LRE family protein [Betaproteobacteria bacterium]
MKIREVTRGLQFPEGPVAMSDGSVILVEIARGTVSRVAADGKVSVVANNGGGPNGAAIGPDGALYVCNNGGFKWFNDPKLGIRPAGQGDDYSGGRIERVNLSTGKVERVYGDCNGRGLRGPNDLVFDAHGCMWFTDLGKVRERDLDQGGVYHARADGGAIREVVHPFMTPNGIGLSPDGKTLYVCETVGARLWAFDITGTGEVAKLPFPSPHGGRCVYNGRGYQRYDSMCVDAFGNALIATLVMGGITSISPDGALVTHVPLSDIYTTNCCFGGRDMRTLFVTLSGEGKLIAIDDWPTPGLPLAYNA